MTVLLVLSVNPRSAGKDLDWGKVKNELCRSKPSCHLSMPGMYRFVLKFGAGKMLDYTTETIKSQVGSDRQLGPDMYDALSQDMKPSTADPFATFRHALLRLAYTGPDKVLNPGDVRRSLSKECKAKVEEATKLILEIMVRVSSLPDPQGEVKVLVAKFQSEIVMLVLGKKHKDMVPWASSMEGTAQVLCDLVKEKTGQIISDKWEAHRPDPKTSSTSSAGSKPSGKTLPLDSV